MKLESLQEKRVIDSVSWHGMTEFCHPELDSGS